MSCTEGDDLLTHTIGTDSIFVFPLITENHEAGTEAPTDLTGAYFYFQIFAADGATILLNLNNDPADASAGVSFRAPETLGVVEVAVANDDLVPSDAGVRLPYIGFVRLGPAGGGSRYEAVDGAITLKAGKVQIT